jgi:hypothetical protein
MLGEETEFPYLTDEEALLFGEQWRKLHPPPSGGKSRIVRGSEIIAEGLKQQLGVERSAVQRSLSLAGPEGLPQSRPHRQVRPARAAENGVFACLLRMRTSRTSSQLGTGHATECRAKSTGRGRS